MSDETEEEMTTTTVACNSENGTGGGPNIEEEGANPTDEQTIGDGDGEPTPAVEANEAAEAEQCLEGGETVIEKSPEGFDQYVKVKHSDVAFMRMGFFNHVKLNTDSMIKMFTQDEWITIDMLIDWDE